MRNNEAMLMYFEPVCCRGYKRLAAWAACVYYLFWNLESLHYATRNFHIYSFYYNVLCLILQSELLAEDMGKKTPTILIFVSLGSFFVTYNIIVMIIQDRSIGSSEWLVKVDKLLQDPVVVMPKHLKKSRSENCRFHVALTATDTLYSKWQSRIMYYWYNKKKGLPGSDMGSFTRILHSGKADNLMDEIPTFVVDPLPNGMDQGYVVLNRPWAFVQWLEMATIDEEYVLMIEPDHIFLNPLPNLAYGDYPAGFHFNYMLPEKHEKIIRKFFPEEKGPITNVDPIGNSPVIIKKNLLEEIAPTWVNISLRIKNDREADKTFGWVQEMYAYAVASALHDVQHILRKDFMIQTPFGKETRNIFILHYTYACDFNMKGELTYGIHGEWSFNKRSYIDGLPPRNLPLPPPGVPESVVTLLKMINEAIANLPNWEAT
ncbi:hypothetical protein Leryth_001474 [Lithospermum erythrorhizon]|nr:hypothetical protein Leryth_001474 [Lithospermum erythrorhizon]